MPRLLSERAGRGGSIAVKLVSLMGIAVAMPIVLEVVFADARTGLGIGWALYGLAAAAAAGLAYAIWRDIAGFDASARQACRARAPGIAERTRVPELAALAIEIDEVLGELQRAAGAVHQAAEDNAHSFRTPLATIQASLDRVRRAVPANDERAQRASSLIAMAQQRLCALIDAAQYLDDGEARIIAAPRQPIDLTQLVSDALLSRRDESKEKGIRLTPSLAERIIVRGNPELLTECVESVLENAMRFSPPGASVAVTLATSGGKAELGVEDEGPGLEGEQAERIFHRFLSLRPPAEAPTDTAAVRSERPRPAGLSLWNAKRNLEAMGGGIDVGNRPQRGLSVRMVLPLAAP